MPLGNRERKLIAVNPSRPDGGENDALCQADVSQDGCIDAPMTPDERREAIRRYGYREPITFEDFPVVAPMLLGTLALPMVGLVLLVSGEGGERAGGSILLVVGIIVLCWAWKYFRRPPAPLDNGDFERELLWRRRRES